MTFHDDIIASYEYEALKCTATLLLYLKTISPESNVELEDKLIEYAKSMGWEIYEDGNIGEVIKYE